MGKLQERYQEKLKDYKRNARERFIDVLAGGVIEGPPGPPGETPEKGVDYFTEEDKREFKKEVTPVKGVDYFDGQDSMVPGPEGPQGPPGPKGEDGKTPIADVDFPGEQALKKMLTQMLPNDKYFKPLIEKIVKEFGKKIELEAAKIARALETLKGKEQLDYYALKNLPSIPSDELIGDRVRTIMRGGGDTVKTYDLDSLLDGVTKTFTLPKHRKIIMVVGTSAPFRFLATTDYTRTATSITFTSAVDASISLASGQGVSVLYV